MPGNEVGDRVHNFFGQENLSQSQHHSQSIDGNWPGLSNNLWVGGQRQIGGPFISSLKNYNLQQQDQERGHGSQPSPMPHGLNFVQSNLKPEFGRVQTPNQQPGLNGYLQGNQVLQARQNETNFLGMDADTNRVNLVARGLSISQQGHGSEHSKKNSMRLDASESPVGFDFFGGQQPMNSQHLNALQTIANQQLGNSDVQLLQRQLMLHQLHEFQRQQQLQQIEPRQQSFMNQVSSVAKQSGGNHSQSPINGVPVNESSNSLWQPEHVPGGGNWLQRGASPAMQGSPVGHMFSAEQGQALRLMDMIPQQSDQSLYGVPISNASGSYSHVQMDKAPIQQVPANSNSFPGSPYAQFPDQVSMQEEARPDFQRKSMFGAATGQALSSGFNLESLQQVNQSPPVQEFHGRQEVAESSEKSFNQVTPSQSAAALDPTEEKILFGSDDNIWEAFGKSSNIGMGGFDVLDNSDFSGGFSSLQSGSWSALMQSAVAETCNGESGTQEEWCGPTTQNSEAPAGNQQLSSANHSAKPSQGIWGGDNSFQPNVAPNSRLSSISADANSGMGSFSTPQFQQPKFKTPQAQGEMLLTDSSQRFTPKLQEQGIKWSDRGTPQKQSDDPSHAYAGISHLTGSETNADSNSRSWTRQQNTSTHSSDAPPYSRPNGWNFINSGPTDCVDNFRTPENKNSLPPALSGDPKRGMHDELGHVAGMWRTDSAPNLNTELAKPSLGSPRVGGNASGLNNIALANSSSMRPNQEGQQQVPNAHKLDFWKVVDSSGSSKGAEVHGKSQQYLGKSPQILESSGNHGLDGGAVQTYEMGTTNYKDYSTDGFHSGTLQHSSTGGSKDNNWSDAAGDSPMFSGGKQKSSGNAGRRSSGTRKFQYHPMGDVDVDNGQSYRAKSKTPSQALSQQVSRGTKGYDQGSFGTSKFGGQMDKASLEPEKEHLSVGQADVKGLDAASPKSMFPGFAPNSSSQFGRGIGNHAPNNVPPSSQLMLELLHKVDHQREQGSGAHMSTSERNLSSEMPETETSEGSVGHIQRNPSSSSQNFGLQLAPPSQRLSGSDHAVSAQSSQQAVFGSTYVSHDGREKGQVHPASRASVAPFHSSYEPSQGQGHNIAGSSAQIVNKASYANVQGGYSSAFPSGFPYARNLENQQMHVSSIQTMGNQSVHMPFNRMSSGSKQFDDSSERARSSQFVPSSMPDLSACAPSDKLVSSAETSHSSRTDQIHKQGPAQQILESDGPPATQLSVQQGVFTVPNSWTGVPSEQSSLGAQSSKAASSLFKTNNSMVMPFSGPAKLNPKDVVERRNELPSSGVISANSQSLTVNKHPDRESCQQQVLADKAENSQKTLPMSQGNETVANNFSEPSHVGHAATQRDIEAFGRSLKPNTNLPPNYSLLHQVQAMKGTEIDSTDRTTKRLKDSDQSSYGYNSIVTDSSANLTSVAPGDLKMLSFSSKPGETRDSNASSQDTFSHNSSNPPSNRSENPQISPLMAPSWFDQYGTFKNGQMLQVFDMQRASSMKPIEQPLIVGNVADDLHARDSLELSNVTADGSKLGKVQEVSAPSDHLSSSQLVPQSTDQSLAVERPKKRKTATSELVPWHKELANTSQRLQTISVAEVEWAKATNRLPEKLVEEVTEMMDDAVPVLRPRRRLVLTTQLMQQLLRPPPAALLSSDVGSQYETFAYASARLALGDACGAASCSESEVQLVAGENKSTSPEILKSPKAVDQDFSKVVEDFIGRGKRLENELLRLDKRASILDLRVECQDLEKFSVINRFAKFHGRGQADGAEISSSDGSPNAQRLVLQRYVTASPMPRNPPDMVQCLSL